MGVKRLIRKVAKFIVFEQPKEQVTVNIAQISHGNLLKNKNIVITGGGSGIGLAMAKKFVQEGANVLISGRNEDRLKQATTQIGAQSSYICFDVSQAEQANEFLMKCKKKFKSPIDCLVSNAGISLHENIFTNVTFESFDKQFNTNFRGNYFLCKAFLEMKLTENTNNANLLLISSETGNQALSRRVYQKGIRVNAIAPGVTLSDMTKEYANDDNGNLYRDCASGRIFLPEEVAEVACFLLSDASRCISGEIIHTNAGNHIKTFWES